MNNMKDALADLNEAIRLNTRESGYYINRGLVRYQLKDLRGAMADYDQVVSMDSHNLIARFNRGLLRAQIGDNNRAIEDFDVVIEIEPDNYMAYYNRALLRYETGDYQGSVHDFDVVLRQYPNFVAGYYSRAEVKRKMHDEVGADRDYWTAYNMEQKRRTGMLREMRSLPKMATIPVRNWPIRHQRMKIRVNSRIRISISSTVLSCMMKKRYVRRSITAKFVDACRTAMCVWIWNRCLS